MRNFFRDCFPKCVISHAIVCRNSRLFQRFFFRDCVTKFATFSAIIYLNSRFFSSFLKFATFLEIVCRNSQFLSRSFAKTCYYFRYHLLKFVIFPRDLSIKFMILIRRCFTKFTINFCPWLTIFFPHNWLTKFHVFVASNCRNSTFILSDWLIKFAYFSHRLTKFPFFMQLIE